MAGSDYGEKLSKVGGGRLIGRICRSQGVLYKLDVTEAGTKATPGSLLILISSSDPILCVLVEQSETQILLEARDNPICSNQEYLVYAFSVHFALVAGAWTERKKMFHGGSFLKLADDNMDIQNPEAQNRELSGF